jgi:hypothetical protein
MMKNDIKTWVHYSVLQMTDTEKKSNHEIKKSDDEQQLLKIMDQFIKMSEMIGAGDQVKNRTLVEKLFVHNMKQPFPMEHNFVEVKDSKLGGRGVFATDDIKEGNIVTYYPMFAYLDHKKKQLISFDDVLTKQEMKHFEKESDRVYDHGMTLNKELTVFGHPDKYDDLRLLGHMFNDIVGNKFDSIETEKDISNGIMRYYLSMSNNNCIIKLDHHYGVMYVIATKDIKKGEEMTVPYGAKYWFQHVRSKKYKDKRYGTYTRLYDKVFADPKIQHLLMNHNYKSYVVMN